MTARHLWARPARLRYLLPRPVCAAPPHPPPLTELLICRAILPPSPVAWVHQVYPPIRAEMVVIAGHAERVSSVARSSVDSVARRSVPAEIRTPGKAYLQVHQPVML